MVPAPTVVPKPVVMASFLAFFAEVLAMAARVAESASELSDCVD